MPAACATMACRRWSASWCMKAKSRRWLIRRTPVFQAAELFAKTEGLVPAPESSHAIRAAIDEALKAKEENRETVILFGLSGHGFLDLGAYESYLDGKLEDFALPEDELRAALDELPKIATRV